MNDDTGLSFAPRGVDAQKLGFYARAARMEKQKISVCIITLNEEANIREACESVAWADEIVVVDSGSSDRTTEIAAEMGARVLHHAWPGFAEQKQFAADHALHEWVLSLDADERVSDELRASIESVFTQNQNPPADGYLIARRTFYMGRWIRGGGWYPDRQLRLYRKSLGRWKGEYIHESVSMNSGARVSTLDGDLLHYTVRNAADHHRMIGERYAPLGAQKMFAEGRRTSPLKIATVAPATFIRNFVFKTGFRDGLAGLSIAAFSAHHAFLKHLELWELQNAKEANHPSGQS